MEKKKKYDMSKQEIIANDLQDYFSLYEKVKDFKISPEFLPKQYKRFVAIESNLDKLVLTGKEIIEILEIYNSILEDKIYEKAGEGYNKLEDLFKKQRKITHNLRQKLEECEDSKRDLIKELRDYICDKEGKTIEELKKIFEKYNF